MRAKKGTKMAAATELLLVYGLDGSIAMVTGPGEVEKDEPHMNGCLHKSIQLPFYLHQ